MEIIETPQGCYGTFIQETISITICLHTLVKYFFMCYAIMF